MRRRMISLCLTVLLLLLLPVTVQAQSFDPGRKGSISVTLTSGSEKTPVPNAELAVYHVASTALNSSNQLSYAYTGAFKDCEFPLDDPELTEKLETFIGEEKPEAQKMVTDSTGKATCSNLPLGLYFVMQQGTAGEFEPCSPFLVTVPVQQEDGFTYDVNASPKMEAAQLVTVTIKVIWNTDSSTKIPGSVTVQLMNHGTVVKTAVLSAENDWFISYDGMPKSDGYSIGQEKVPQGFTPTYSQESPYDFVVTYTASLAETGQLVWPIPVLAILGLVLLATGAILLRKPGKEHA